MEENIISIKCSAKEHEKIDAISFCQQCNIYMCHKCDNIHKNLCQNHITFNSNKNDIFTGYCKENGHFNKIEYFCKNHNQLCCDACIIKIKAKGKGEHKDCDICLIEEIKDLKKNKLKENINYLEELLNNIEEKINQLKINMDKLNEEKEELKLKIQKIFTKMRNIINEREDKLLLEVDKKFDETYFNEKRINEFQKLPNKIKISLEKGKLIEQEWNDENKLCSCINDCINIENNIKNACDVNDSLKKSREEKNNKLDFYPNDEKEINKILGPISSFGKIFNKLTLFFDSKIINKNEEYIQNIKKWFTNKNQFITELLYRKTDNGDSYNTFHQLCDNKGPTIILIEGTEGFIIGGYTPLSWDSNSSWKNDNETFLFSLTNNQVFNKNIKEYNNGCSILCSKKCGPNFCCIRFKEKNNMSKCSFSTNCSYYINLNNIISSNWNSRDFDTEEVEVYKIIFI